MDSPKTYKVSDYHIILHEHQPSFEADVMAHLEAGWGLHGKCFTYQNQLAQAVIKYEPVEEN